MESIVFRYRDRELNAEDISFIRDMIHTHYAQGRTTFLSRHILPNQRGFFYVIPLKFSINRRIGERLQLSVSWVIWEDREIMPFFPSLVYENHASQGHIGASES